MTGSTIAPMHRRRAIVPTLALVSILVGACGFGPDTVGSGAPSSLPVETAPAETDAPTATETLDPSLPAQSDTDWGPIWNAIPPSYPAPAGAQVADAADGPVSGAYTVRASVLAPRAIAEFYETALDEAGFGGTGIDGPLEDGSFTVWSSTGYGCDSLVTILPRGSESLITVLYGAGCEFD